MARVEIALDYVRGIQLALQQNGVPVLEVLRLTNVGDAPLEDLLVTVVADPAIARELTRGVARIDVGATLNLQDLELTLSTDRLVSQTERETGCFRVEVRQGEDRIGEATFPLEILAFNEWAGVAAPPELLSAFVQPNHPAVATLLGGARELLRARTGRPDLEGYQSRDPARVLAIVGAVYDSIGALDITYVNPPASFERTGQKVRTPDQVLEARMGTCLDLSAVMAAALEQCGLRPLVVVIEGHAFLGAWLTEWAFPSPVLDDPVPLRKRVDLGEIVVFDSSSAAQGVSFREATALARGWLDNADVFRFVVDVHSSRRTGIRPLPMRVGAAFAELPDPQVAEGPASLPTLPVSPDRPQGSEGPESKLDRWKARLLDLSLHNRLLNHRDSKRVLPVVTDDLQGLVDVLDQGGALRFVPQVQGAPVSPGELAVALTEAELGRRGLELFRTGRANLQETGANPTYLALGFLRWFESSSSTQPRTAPLLLVPVTVDRLKVHGPYTLRLADDDPMMNVTLLRKLEQDFGIDVTGYDEVPATEGRPDAARLLQRFRALVRDVDRFEVLPQAVVTLYAFRKFLMWVDLEQRTEDLLASPVVKHLVQGAEEPFPVAAPFVQPAELDRVRPAHVDLSVVDADSSQLAAVFGALDGNSFVLQGPPGTGKSQTITNLVAQALARDKTVLFVSEKRAALEVVHERLVRIGLGPFCLEAHSEKASKKQVLAQLQEPLQLTARRSQAQWVALADELQALRLSLDAHVAALHTPGPWGETVFQGTSRLIGLQDAPRVALDLDPPDPAGLRAMRQVVDVLAARAAEVGTPAGHRLAFVGARDWSPGWVRSVEAALDEGIGRLTEALDALSAVFEALRLPSPATEGEWDRQIRLLKLLRTTPQPPLALLTRPKAEVDAVLDELLTLGGERAVRWADLGQRFLPAVLEKDRRADAAWYARWAGAFFLFAWFALFFARQRVAPLLRGKEPDYAQVAEDLSAAGAIRELDEKLVAREEQAERLLGHRWRRAETDWDEVRQLRSWAAELRPILAGLPTDAGLRELATDGAERLAPGTPLGDALAGACEAHDRWVQASVALQDVLSADHLPGDGLQDRLALLREIRGRTSELRAWTAWRRVTDEAGEVGLEALVEAVSSGAVAAEQVRDAFERALRESWLEGVLAADERLRHFRGVDHEQRIARFRELDARAAVLAREQIVAHLASRLPDPDAPGEMATLRRELQKKRAHRPIRSLFAEVPHVLPRLKPCVLMSPLSVARFLDPALEGFDLVVFDEASQIAPWDAVGAIARGRQVVVVGDSKQLPPTTFFQRGEEDEPDDDDQIDLESILDEAVASGMPQHLLSWHYRSRHEALIAFSNLHYYDNRLHTFPAASSEVPWLGVKWVHVPGVYDKGRSRTNRAEAEAVVAEILRRVRDPELRSRSIGVVTFSMAQQRLIEDLLDAERQDPVVEDALTSGEEPLFIKNLESVQGDERDVMLFSVGYGPDAHGRVSMNFGPLNRVGGERRLNVAITRARELLMVFSTLRPEQIDLARTRAVGVRHFKTFLDYASRGPKAIDEALQLDLSADFDSPFEAQVCERLEAAGHTVHRQVGCAGYRIDLAVVDPDAPGTYLLGIECDGATYHSAPAARDRDRIRAQVLRGLGWRLHRIWSTDWWHDPDGETERLLTEVERLRTEPRELPRTPPLPKPRSPERPKITASEEPPAPEEPVVTRWPEHAVAWRPTTLAGGPREELDRASSLGRVQDQIAQAVEQGAPFELDALVRMVASAWGSRAGSRIRQRIEEAIVQAPGVAVRDGVVWRIDQDPGGWTGFRYCDGDDGRDLTTVPLVELENAARWVLERAIALDEETLCREVAGVFGVSRAGSRVRERVAEAVERLIARGGAERGDGVVRQR